MEPHTIRHLTSLTDYKILIGQDSMEITGLSNRVSLINDSIMIVDHHNGIIDFSYENIEKNCLFIPAGA